MEARETFEFSRLGLPRLDLENYQVEGYRMPRGFWAARITPRSSTPGSSSCYQATLIELIDVLELDEVVSLPVGSARGGPRRTIAGRDCELLRDWTSVYYEALGRENLL